MKYLKNGDIIPQIEVLNGSNFLCLHHMTVENLQHEEGNYAHQDWPVFVRLNIQY